VRWTAREIDEDGGFGFGALHFASGRQAEIAGEADTGAESADAEEITAFDTVTGEGESHKSRPWDGGCVGGSEIRNPKHEIQNKSEAGNSNVKNADVRFSHWHLKHLNLFRA
jgi:hypothetical protein